MIQAYELMIGNYILTSLKSGQGRKLEKQIGVQDIVRIYENTGYFNYEPIPLTEEWLLKLGFIKDGYDYWSSTKEYFELIDFENGEYSLSVNNGEYIQGKRFKNVHQLQNLYFALTGEQLTIKD